MALVFIFGGNMKKKFLAIALATLTVSTLAGCTMKSPEMTSTSTANTKESTDSKADSKTESKADSKSDGAEVTLVYAEVNPLDTIVGQSGTAFKEKVEELSGGKIHIDIQASGVLGSENDVLDGMLGGTGTVDMSRISAFALTSYGAKKASLLSMPYTFNSREHFWKFVDSDLSKEFLQETSDLNLGIKSLYYGEEGFRHFFTKNPVTKVEDLKGMKLRVSNDPIMNGMVEGLGASPTVVAFNELYSALQTGVVDGAEQPITNYKSNAFPEVAPNIILDGHTLGAFQVVITDTAWDKLTKEQQDVLVEAGKYVGQVNREIAQKAEDKVLEELKANKVNVVEVADKSPWREATKGVVEKYTADQKELYQKILDLDK